VCRIRRSDSGRGQDGPLPMPLQVRSIEAPTSRKNCETWGTPISFFAGTPHTQGSSMPNTNYN